MNEKLNRLSTRILQLEKRKFDLAERLNEVQSQLENAQEEFEKAEMEYIDLSDRVDVHFIDRSDRVGVHFIESHPAKVFGDLAIIKLDGNWQICSVFQGKRVRDCQTLEIALELIERLKQFDWSFAQGENPFSKEIIDFMSAWEKVTRAIAQF